MKRFSAFVAAGIAALSSGLPAGGMFTSGSSAALATSSNMVMPSTVLPPMAAYQLNNLGRPNLQNHNKTNLRPLRHRWAVGLDSAPGVSPTINNAVSTVNALGLRWWAGDRLGVDLLAGGNYSSQENGGGVLSPVVSRAPGSWALGGGLGLRYNVSEPSSDLLVQAIARASGAQSSQAAGLVSAQSKTTTVAGFVGLGVEAFIPGWDWFSVEASAGLTGLSQSLTYPDKNGTDTALSGIGLAGNGYSPVNLAVHVYF